MKQSDTLELVDAGTLTRPGPIGRLFRLALGVLCLYALADIVSYIEWTTMQPFSSLGNRLLLLLAPFWVISYVVNIGFSRDWKKWPAFARYLKVVRLQPVTHRALTMVLAQR